MGTFVKHIPCENCSSRDGNSLYADGTTYCFVCDTYGGSPDGEPSNRVTDDNTSKKSRDLIRGSYQDIKSRGIREETCQKFGYEVGEFDDEKCHIANYRLKPGQAVAQKIRGPNKKFTWTGDPKKVGLFGQHLFNGGRSVVVTEGEIDCLSVSQAFNNKYAVVSLANGAQSAVKALAQSYEWLCQFEKVVLCFDNDKPGQEAIDEACQMLPMGKAFIMRLPDPYKDANEALMDGNTEAITSAFWNAEQWKPDGIISGRELTKERLKAAKAVGYSLPYPKLNEMLGGLRERELTLLTAGSGVGKSTIARELGYYLQQTHGLTIGNVFLEESVEKTAQAYVAIHNNVPLGKLRRDPDILTDEQWEDGLRVTEGMFFYDHFGSINSDALLAKIRYLKQVLGCTFVILDHISIVISGQTSSSEGERRDIDILMTKLRSLIEETGVGIIAIVHLRQPEGKAHEEGGRVTLSQLRGSGSLKQLSDNVVALERDQQDQEEANLSTARVLKCREDGNLGEADELLFNKETGRLLPAEEEL